MSWLSRLTGRYSGPLGSYLNAIKDGSLPDNSAPRAPALVELIQRTSEKEKVQGLSDVLCATNDDSDVVRKHAFLLLNKLYHGCDAAIPRLIKTLDDSHVALHVIDVLASFGPKAKAAVPKLIAMLTAETPKERAQRIDAEDFFHDRIVRCLGAIGPDARAAVPHLVELSECEWAPDTSDALKSIRATQSTKGTIKCLKCSSALSVTGHRVSAGADDNLVATFGLQQVRLRCPRCHSVMDVTLEADKDYE